jgi:hypothetical protein
MANEQQELAGNTPDTFWNDFFEGEANRTPLPADDLLSKLLYAYHAEDEAQDLKASAEAHLESAGKDEAADRNASNALYSANDDLAWARRQQVLLHTRYELTASPTRLLIRPLVVRRQPAERRPAPRRRVARRAGGSRGDPDPEPSDLDTGARQ